MKNNRLLLIFVCVLVLLSVGFLSACSSTNTAVKQEYLPFNYSAADVLRSEIGRIENLLKPEPVQALWRAFLMRNSAQFTGEDEQLKAEVDSLWTKCVGAVKDLCIEQAAKKNYADALRLYQSLQAVESPALESIPHTEATLSAKMLENVPGYENLSPTDTPPPMSTFINGTVTVWVDLGIKVEKGMGYASSAIGSGFFIDKRGYIVTNYHVVQTEVDPKYEGFSRLYIRLAEDPDTKIPAKVIGWDPVLDIALLKAEVSAPYVFKLGSSAGLDPGDRVFAIGSPVGLDRTLTSGIVSAVNRQLFSVGTVMQIDAAVNSGNSGGPLIDNNGNVQAIVFAGLLQYEGLNFAIPVEYLIHTLPQLFQGGKRGQSWLGAFGRTYRDIATDVSGIEIQYVLPGGSAARSSLAPGDIITAINSRSLSKLEDLQTALMRASPGAIVKVDGIRSNGTAFSVAVYLADRPQNPGLAVFERDIIASAFIPIFGMELVSISASNRRKYSVSKVLKAGIADEAGFSVQDPVDVLRVQLSKEKDALYAELYTKKRRNGYFEVNIAIAAPLDSPYYF